MKHCMVLLDSVSNLESDALFKKGLHKFKGHREWQLQPIELAVTTPANI